MADKLRRIFVLACLASLIGSFALVRAGATSAFAYPNGTVIQLVVPWGPGGGNDLVARLVQPAFEEALDALGGHNVTVIVVDKPGAGTRVGTEYVYHSPPDGTRLELIDSDAAPIQELDMGASFHVAKFTYIGQVNKDDWGILVTKKTGIRTMGALIAASGRQPILVGTAGAGGGDQIGWLLAQAVLKEHGTTFPLNFVNFNSSPTVYASMQRGEAQAYFGSLASLLPATDGGYAGVVVVFSAKRSAYYPNVPTAFEEHVPGAASITALVGLTRVLVAPPGIPADRTAVLRTALKMALADPTLLARAAKARVPIDYGTAAQAYQVMMAREQTLAKYKKIVSAALSGTAAK